MDTQQRIKDQVTGNKVVAFELGLRMIRLILEYRAKSILFPRKFER